MFAKGLLLSIKKRFPSYGLKDDLTAWASLLDPKQKKVLLDEVNLTEVTKRTLEGYINRLVEDVEVEEQPEEVEDEGKPPEEESPMQKLKRRKSLGNTDPFEEETSAGGLLQNT